MEDMLVSSTENNGNYMDARCEKANAILGTLPESQGQSQKSADDDFDVSSLFIS